jgi:VanZ family protein
VRLWSRIKSWLPAIFWAGLISSLSIDAFSSEHTSHFIIPALHWLAPHASKETLELLHHIIRKSAHVTEYFIFSTILVRALRGKNGKWTLRLAICAVAISAGYAALDEFHQSFVPSRTASPWDAALDVVGASAAQVFSWIWQLKRERSAVLNNATTTDRTAELR